MRGLLLVNLGTPDAPEEEPVRRYLEEFLLDPRVVDLPWAARQLLVRGVILRTRPARSAEAYRRIWDPERGSPLLFHSLALTGAVRAAVGEGWKVALGMRYGNPSIRAALDELAGADEIVVLPLFPQYATATAESVRDAMLAQAPAGVRWRFIEDFATDPAYVAAVAEAAAPVIAEGPDHVLFSFHGIPERQLFAASPHGRCLTGRCCEPEGGVVPRCYKARCRATAAALAARLGLAPGTWSVSFQSRLGRTVWIGPYTDDRVDALAAAGVKHLAVLTPSFVADCLETLEEIGIGERDRFLAGGGERFSLARCPNGSAALGRALAGIAGAAG